ncbi:LysE family translocator [Microvirga sp. 2YAF29]|uniref:LysE family translocator n=1 Tax=Microvirga sp. 2YAF29 TaxID=3233031 RepID=UPI003F99BF88
MSATSILISILGALLIGAVSPGPSFVLVSRIAITASRLDGLAAALGMGLGGAVFGALALLGLSTLLSQVEWLYLALKLTGGAYLVYLGLRIWKVASEPLEVPDGQAFKTNSLLRSFAFAFITQISNPKTAVVYASIFAALLPPSPPMWMLIIFPPLIFSIEAGWYVLVALAFSNSRPRSLYLGFKRWIDRTAGFVIGALGLRLIAESMTLQKS